MAKRLTKRLAWLQENGVEMPWRPLPADIPFGKPSHCHFNCARLAFRRRKLRYVEGLALMDTCSDERHKWHSVIWRPDISQFARLIPHAWLLDEEGYVVDPTWEEDDFHNGRQKLYLGTVIPTDVLRRLLDRTGWYMGYLPRYWKPPVDNRKSGH